MVKSHSLLGDNTRVGNRLQSRPESEIDFSHAHLGKRQCKHICTQTYLWLNAVKELSKSLVHSLNLASPIT